MTQSWSFILNEMISGVGSTIWSLLTIIIPLFIIIEALVQLGAMEKLAQKLGWFAKLLRVEDKAVLPLIIAILMGVSYGAGTLIELTKENPLSRHDFIAVGAFMYMCHSMIETILLFMVAGANIWMISVGRFVFALVVTMLISRSKFVEKLFAKGAN